MIYLLIIGIIVFLCLKFLSNKSSTNSTVKAIADLYYKEMHNESTFNQYEIIIKVLKYRAISRNLFKPNCINYKLVLSNNSLMEMISKDLTSLTFAVLMIEDINYRFVLGQSPEKYCGSIFDEARKYSFIKSNDFTSTCENCKNIANFIHAMSLANLLK